MNNTHTNRDLYQAVADLTGRFNKTERTLEEWLIALWSLSMAWKGHAGIPARDFLALLDNAFTSNVPAFDPAWISRYSTEAPEAGFAGWESTILTQIIDLHEMAEGGAEDDDLGHFGARSPRGSYWVNTDPLTFLACAAEGTFRGWTPGNGTGREYVPGPVVVLDGKGGAVTKNPEEISRPVFAIETITWSTFSSFLGWGQQCE